MLRKISHLRTFSNSKFCSHMVLGPPACSDHPQKKQGLSAEGAGSRALWQLLGRGTPKHSPCTEMQKQ